MAVFRYVKPIMFSAGIGQMDGEHAVKGEPEVGMWVVKVSHLFVCSSSPHPWLNRHQVFGFVQLP